MIYQHDAENRLRTLHLFFVNKFALAESPMATVSIMATYAMAQEGTRVTLILEGDPGTDTKALLRDRFNHVALPNYSITLISRFLGRLKLTELYYLKACWFILRKRVKGCRTVVISRNTTFLPWMALLRLSGCVVVFETHSYHGDASLPHIPPRPARKYFSLSSQYKRIEKTWLRFAHGLVCITRPQRELYRRDFPFLPTATLPLGAPAPSDRMLLPDALVQKQIVYIGRAVASVEDELLFKALALCRDTQITLCWIGLREQDFKRMEKFAADHGVRDRVTLKPWLSHAHMTKWLHSNAGAGLAAYRGDFMNAVLVCPTKLFDYFAAGLPVIASRIPTVEDFVTDSRQGYLYEPGSAAGLANAMERVFEDRNKYLHMREHSLESARRFSWENRAKAYIHFATTFTPVDLLA